jgi:hypothetical protein
MHIKREIIAALDTERQDQLENSLCITEAEIKRQHRRIWFAFSGAEPALPALVCAQGSWSSGGESRRVKRPGLLLLPFLAE